MKSTELSLNEAQENGYRVELVERLNYHGPKYLVLIRNTDEHYEVERLEYYDRNMAEIAFRAEVNYYIRGRR